MSGAHTQARGGSLASGWLPRLAWLAIAAAALWLRLFQIGDQILIDDELHALAKVATSDYHGIATTLGLQDHSIPLTLFYKWLALHGLLSEIPMLALPWLAGVGAIAFCMRLAWRHARPAEALVFGALLAVSPLLVLYTRQARPYAITLFLGLVAAWAAWRWSRTGRLRDALLHLGCAVLAVWFHPVAMPFVFGAWVFLLIEWIARSRHDRRRLLQILGFGALAGLLAGALLAPAVVNDWGSVRVKIAADAATWATAWRALHTMAGSRSSVLAVLMAMFVVIGASILWRRSPRASAFALTLVLLQVVAVIASGARWLDHALVLSRYLLLCLPPLLFAAAVGFARCIQPLGSKAPALRALAGAALFASLYLSGPLPAALAYPNAFFGHYLYFLDVDPARNDVVAYLRAGPMPAFYEELGKRPPGSLTLIEAPWRFESVFNREPLFQRVHRQRVEIGMVGNLCPPGSYGEQARALAPNRFRHFVDLTLPIAELRKRGDFVVFHRRLELANMTEPWEKYEGKGLPPVDACIAAFRRELGAPVFEDDTITVFALARRH